MKKAITFLLFFLLSFSSVHALNSVSETATVSRVIDGDTIELSDGRKVRYIGINTPETTHPQKGQECFGQEAKQKNAEIVEGKTVILERDVTDTDRYGRLLRYVYVDEVMINEQLVAEGFAFSSPYPPDVKFQERFDELQQSARQGQLGLWGAECPVGEVQGVQVTWLEQLLESLGVTNKWRELLVALWEVLI